MGALPDLYIEKNDFSLSLMTPCNNVIFPLDRDNVFCIIQVRINPN